jgi:hypothetical protein
MLVGSNHQQEQGMGPFVSKYSHTLATSLLTIIGWSALVAVGLAGWPGTDNRCVEDYLEYSECFCEKIDTSRFLRQPANTVSNLAYAGAALFCAIMIDTKHPSNWWSANVNLLTEQTYFTMSFCLLLTNISYCSAFMHGGYKKWGGKMDGLSITVFFLWIELFSICKFALMWHGWTKESVKTAVLVHGVILTISTTVLFILDFTIGIPAVVMSVLLYLVALALILEIAVQYIHQFCMKKHRLSQAWIGYAVVVLFLVALVLQIVSKSGSQMCNPDSFFQGHALWHLISALACGTLFFFFLSEKFTMKRRGAQDEVHLTQSSHIAVKDLRLMMQEGAAGYSSVFSMFRHEQAFARRLPDGQWEDVNGKMDAEKLRVIFDNIDKDGDGAISRDELKEFMDGNENMDKEEFDSMWKVIDGNMNNLVDFGEFTHFMKGVRVELDIAHEMAIKEVHDGV